MVAQPIWRGRPFDTGGAESQGVISASSPARKCERIRSQRRTHLAPTFGIRSARTSCGYIAHSLIEEEFAGVASDTARAARPRVRHMFGCPDGVSQLRLRTARMTSGSTGVLGFGGQRPGARWPARWRPPGFRRWGRMPSGTPCGFKSGVACAPVRQLLLPLPSHPLLPPLPRLPAPSRLECRASWDSDI